MANDGAMDERTKKIYEILVEDFKQMRSPDYHPHIWEEMLIRPQIPQKPKPIMKNPEMHHL